MNVRRFQYGEEATLWRLFYETIHTVNARDYTPEQLDAWAPQQIDHRLWEKRTRERNPFVASVENQIVGYADLQTDGLIDHFFVHHQWQRRGVGTALMAAIEAEATTLGLAELYSDVSLTARRFFGSHGFHVVIEQEVAIDDFSLRNCRMTKLLSF